MLAVTPQCHPGRADSLDSAHGVAFYAGHLHQATDRVTGQAKIVFHGYFRRVFNLLRCATQGVGEGARGHGTGRSHLTLAAHLSP